MAISHALGEGKMKGAFAAICGSLALCAPTILAAGAAPQEVCGVMYDKNGESELMRLDNFSVIELTATKPQIKISGPDDQPVKAMYCRRASLVPEANDWKVLVTTPFILYETVAPERVAVIELVNGQLQVRMLDGKMNDAERTQVGAWLDAAQIAYDHR
jgi:hypothetical protein